MTRWRVIAERSLISSMQNDGSIILIVLAILLVVAIGWVVFHVGRIVLLIFLEQRSRKAPIELQHAELGRLVFEGRLWEGALQRDGRTIRFYIAGTKSGPDAVLVERLRSVVVNFPEIERAALERLRSQTPVVGERVFTFEALDILWEKSPDAFAMEFSLTDDDGIWRVEFEAGRPKSVGRDD